MVTNLITFGSNNTAANDNSKLSSLGGVFDDSGNLIVFDTLASNLIGSIDDNNLNDVYIYNISTKTYINLTLRGPVGSISINGNENPSISGDGTRVVFQYSNPSTGSIDIYLATNLFGNPPTFSLVTPFNTNNNINGSSRNPKISRNGRFIVYETTATIPTGSGDDADRDFDIILFDTVNNSNTWVSQISNSGGNPFSPGSSTNGTVSEVGTVAFQSLVPENELMPGPAFGNNGFSDIFLFSASNAGETLTLVSFNQNIAPLVGANGGSFNASISANGNFIAYESDASNLVAGDTNGQRDIFVYNVNNGTNKRINLRPGGIQTQGASRTPSISADGRFVAFASDDSSLVANDTNGVTDIFVWDGIDNSIKRVSLGTNGEQADAPASNPIISSDGRFVSFQSRSTTLGMPTTAGTLNIFSVSTSSSPNPNPNPIPNPNPSPIPNPNPSPIPNPNPSPADTLTSPFFRFQNTNQPGTYLFVSAGEASSIRSNPGLSQFVEEGIAFRVALQKTDPLQQAFFRFQNTSLPGTYLFANEGEAAAIRSNPNLSNFVEEGLAFYAYGPGTGNGTADFTRFQSVGVPGTYLFTAPGETSSVIGNPNFVREGIAFSAALG
ncbi:MULTISPECIES: PD40 domain-containing protein [Synechocystis]|uniref:PD40 domain-containing protein n=1 Tax=Synechocystis salina LEGE 00031 TaxID=1828736 RepID=A0ABR9VZI1_9SYNC|nr:MULTISPECIES: PD40 domain-containing protein [Synechocystis]MBE9197246.1 PD40 domain-containing protein [Synechocystis sp. LEGE 06083]MBE9242947.1 PD40 domain-containing protein [Synechocystis salina LEGE 00041]MBE9255803.1 PD40 domain-containing protein [Synechocystis salina LEGE 00031]